MAKIAVVDDTATVREVVVTYLRKAGHEVVEADEGQAALTLVAQDQPDLVILDLMLPDVDGREVCEQLRQTSTIPIIMLTALGTEEDRVQGLSLGADDYVTKPFSPRELVLRVDSVLRRMGDRAALNQSRVVDGDLIIDPQQRLVTRGGERLSLTLREFDLLQFFLTHPNRAYSRDELLSEVWGWSFGDESTVTVHVRRLREKVESDPTTPSRLETVWGV